MVIIGEGETLEEEKDKEVVEGIAGSPQPPHLRLIEVDTAEVVEVIAT